MRDALTVDRRDLDSYSQYLEQRIEALQRYVKECEATNAALRLELADARAAMHDGLMTFLVADGRGV